MNKGMWFLVNILNGIFTAILVAYYSVPWYVAIFGVVAVAILNYAEGTFRR